MSGKKLSKNIIIYGLSNGLKSLVPFIMLPILTSYISAEGYGLLSIIETSILFLTPFILLNVESGASVEYHKSSKNEVRKYISNGIIIALGSFIAVFILFYFTRNLIGDFLEIPPSTILLLPIFVILRLIPSMVLILFQAQQKAFSYLTFSLLQTVVDFGLSALFVMHLLYGFMGRLEGTYGAFFLFTIIGAVVINKMGYLKLSVSVSKMKEVLSFGLPLIPHVIGATIIALSDRFFISHYQGAEEVGFYTVSYQIGAILLLFSRSVNQAWGPMLYGLIKTKDFKTIEKITAWLFMTFIGVCGLVYISSDFIFEILIDPSFFSAKNYFPFLLLGFLFQSLYFLFTNFIFYQKRTEILATITFSCAVINLVLNYILINKYGVIGVAIATAITWFLYFLTTFLVVKVNIYYSIKSLD